MKLLRAGTAARRRGYFLARLLLTAVAVAAPLLALHVYGLVRQKNLDEAAAVSVLRTRAENAAQALDAAFSRIEGMVNFLGSRVELQTLDRERCGPMISGLAAVDPVLANIGAVDLQGGLICLAAVPSAPQRSYKDAPWFAAAVEHTANGQWYFSKPYHGDVSRRLLVNIVAPLRDRSGRRIGLIAAAVDLTYLSQRILASANLPPGSVVGLVDADGFIVARDPDLVGRVGRALPADLRARSRQSGERPFTAQSSNGSTAYFAVKKLQHYGLHVGAASPNAVIMANSRQSSERSALAVVAAGCFGLLFALYAARRLSDPLRSLRRSARASAQGDADARADESLPGAFHDLAVEFNAMLDAKKAGEASRRAQAAAEAASSAKSEFLAHMSHEIRTPMNAILGLTGLVLRTELTPRQLDYLTKSKMAADSLLELIDRILDFSKIEAGKLELENRDFILDEVLGRVTVIVGNKAHQRHLELLISVAPDVPQRMVGDAQRLAQVLVNLCNNAVKFTAAGEILIRVTRVGGDAKGATLRFSVRDSGIGMSAAAVERLFQPFTQADASTSRQYGGSGLGLAISKQLVQLMGGSIGVASELGTGSEFHFTARFDLPADAAMPALATPPTEFGGMRVLVVDDSPDARDVLAALLEAMACDVSVVGSAEECLAEVERCAASNPYDAVLIDCNMPGMDGFQAAHRVRSLACLPRQPLVIMVSVYGDERISQQTRAEGLDGCLAKPVMASTLRDALAIALGRTPAVHASVATRPVDDPNVLSVLRGRHVLLVEDNEVNQLVAGELLRSVAGMRVTVAASGPEAIEALHAQAIDAVLMDVQLPQMDGYETTRRIRSEAAFAELPIIAMTAYATPRDRDRCLAAGMNDHVSKPFEHQMLLAVLARWLLGVESLSA